jgi:protein-L-isoaspartate(D-aspartate) O-methyltransferase
LDQTHLDEVRRTFARELVQVSGSPDPRLEEVFYRVPREAFLPPGPWKLLAGNHFVETANADPVSVYQNVVIALDVRKGINNGEPHLHAMWIGAVAPQPGENVTQIGLGMGYYSAILSLLVLPGGHLVGFEIDAELASAARHNLKNYENVSVVTGDATLEAIPPSDLIYVSAGVVAPPLSWLQALRPGGRLIFPWRPSVEVALTMLVRRVKAGFEARPMVPCWFIPCAGALGTETPLRVPTIAAARGIRSLHLARANAPDETAVAIHQNLWFSSAELSGQGGI